MRRRIGALRNVIEGPSDAWLGIRMLAWSAVLPALKHLLPLHVLTKLMWAERRAIPRPERERKVIFLARRIYRARAFLRRDNCLERSLLLYRYLAREGIEPRLVIGAESSDEQIRGHAWVTVDGSPVIEGRETVAQFTPLTEFGAGGTRTDDRSDLSTPVS